MTNQLLYFGLQRNDMKFQNIDFKCKDDYLNGIFTGLINQFDNDENKKINIQQIVKVISKKPSGDKSSLDILFGDNPEVTTEILNPVEIYFHNFLVNPTAYAIKYNEFANQSIFSFVIYGLTEDDDWVLLDEARKTYLNPNTIGLHVSTLYSEQFYKAFRIQQTESIVGRAYGVIQFELHGTVVKTQ